MTDYRGMTLADGTVIDTIDISTDMVEVTSDGSMGIPLDTARRYVAGQQHWTLNGEPITYERAQEVFAALMKARR